MALEFGEKTVYMKARGDKLNKLKARWGVGIFVGVRRKTNEILVATPGQVGFARSVKRLPVEKRWREDSVNWVTWAPWNRYKDHEERDEGASQKNEHGQEDGETAAAAGA